MHALIPPARRRALQTALIRWFSRHARDLPWRRQRTPYRIWVSEIMLQQTRVDQVIDYYIRFLARFPTLAVLARAPLDDVLKAWEGLGYYTRARQLHAAARLIMQRHGGRFPRNPEYIRALPGIGPYTAAAIGSMAFGHDAAALDGNVTRVLARVFAYEGDVAKPAARKELQQLAEALLARGRAGIFNEGLMELGATVCLPRRPLCGRCPWARWCAARARGDVESYPRKTRKKHVPHKQVGAGIVRDEQGRFLIAQRKADSMLGGLWEFPGGTREAGESIEMCIARELMEELGIEVEVGPLVVCVRHAFSHFTMDLHAHACHIRSGRPRAIHCAAWTWVRLDEMDRYAFGRADQKIIEQLRAEAVRRMPSR